MSASADRRSLLDAVFSDLRPDEQIYVFEKPGKDRRLFDSIQAVIDYADQHPNSDLYFGVAPRVRGSFDSPSRVTAIWVDIDYKDFGDDPKKAQNALAEFPLLPNFVISSGNGLHAYWLLMDSVPPRRAQDDLMKPLCDLIGADATHNPDRVLRIPGTKNWKDPDNPKDVTVLRDKALPLHLSRDIEALMNTSAKVRRLIATGDASGFPSTSERDFLVIGDLVSAGASNELILEIFRTRRVGDRFARKGEQFFEEEIDRVRDKFISTQALFAEIDQCYYVNTSRGRKKVSTFVFDPVKLLRSVEGNEDALLGTVFAGGKEWPDVVLPKSAFHTTNAFLKLLPNIEWQWEGTDSDTKRLLLYLSGKLYEKGMPATNCTHTLGRHGSFWVTKGATVGKDAIFSPDEAEYTYRGRIQTSRNEKLDTVPRLEYVFPEPDEYEALTKALSQYIRVANRPGALIPMLGWYMAAPLRPLFIENGIRFPHLNVFGTRGSGKTSSILYLFAPLLGQTDNKAWSSNTTSFVIRSLLSSTNAIPVVFGEFRVSTVHRQFLSVLRMAYDVGMDARGRPDLTVEVYPLTAPVVIDGEDALPEGALKERSILVNLHPSDIAEGTMANRAFKALLRLPLNKFAGRYIRRTLRETPESVQKRFDVAHEETFRLSRSALPDRVRNNLAVVLVGLGMYNEHMARWGGQQISWEEDVFEEVLGSTLTTLLGGRTRIEVDDLIEDLLAQTAKADLGPLPYMGFYDEQKNTLWIHLNTAVRWWERFAMSRGRSTLDMPAIRAQMCERCGLGSYILSEREIVTNAGRTSCFGINIERAKECGLNVPEALDPDSMAIRQALLAQSPVGASTP